MKVIQKMVTAIVAIAVIGSVGTATASPGGQAFNTSAGTLNVDYANYLSKHDIIFNKPITNPVYGSTVGNGKMGAMVWNANGLTAQIAGVDASEETVFSGGLANLYTSPGMDTGYSTFQQRLSLYDGLLTTKYDSNRTVTIMGSPNSEVMGIHVDDSRTGVSSVTFDLGLWDVSNLTGGDVPDINTWRTVSTFADSTAAGFSRGQTDANNFGYTLAATVEGASYSAQIVNGSTVRITITPSSSYTIWITCASRLNAPNHDSVTQAHNLLSSVKSTGYATTLANYKNWWHTFWNKSFVQYSNASGDADYLENMYYLYNYMIAAGGYGNYPFHFINGVFSAVGDDHSNKWGVAYWYWNQRNLYNSMLASNHVDVMDTFNNLYSRNYNALKSYTMTKYGIDGIWVPETMGWDGNARHTDDSPFTRDILSTGTEAAENMYLRYRYTNDAAYLANTAYPFIREVCKFYTSKLSFDNSTGQYYMAVSNSHETYWEVQNAITDLAAIRSLFPVAIQISTQLNVDSGLRAQWQNVVGNLAPYKTDSTGYLPMDPPLSGIKNGENVSCELIWPYSVTGIGAPDYNTAVTTWNNRPFPYGAIWANDAVQAARLGLGDSAYVGMKGMLEINQNYPNGCSADNNGQFEYCGMHLCTMNEALLQSYNDIIRVFPAIPSDSTFAGKFTLLAKGGFLVSSELEAGSVKYIGVKSLYGNSATVANPWGTQALQVRRVSDNAVILTTSSSQFNFATAANTVYIVERTSKLFSSYAAEQLTGTANQDAKTLDSITIGSYIGAPPDTGKYEAEKGTLTNCVSSGDIAASNGHEVTNISVGSSVTWSNVKSGTSLDIRYCTYADPGLLHLYVNGAMIRQITFPTTQSWTGTYATITVSVTIPAGATITLANDPGDAGTNLDFIQVNGSGGATVPSAPTGLTASAGNGQVSLSWSASSGATSYNVYRNNVKVNASAVSGAAYTDTGLTNGTAYTYAVTAVNSAGESAKSASVSATPNLSAPAAPTGLTATAGNAQVVLSWAASTGASSYNVYRGTSAGGESATAIVTGITTTSYTNTGLTNGTRYYYTVKAVNGSGSSGASNEANATPSSGSSTPYGGSPVQIAATGATSIEAENYDLGGEAIAYHSAYASNPAGSTYRSSDSVAIYDDPAAGNTHGIGWTTGGEWQKYTVNVAAAGTYTIAVKVASTSAISGALHVADTGGANLTGAINVPNTGAWTTYQATAAATVSLSAGAHTLQLFMDNGGYNIDSIVVNGAAAAATKFNQGQYLGVNQYIVSPSKNCFLVQQSDGNLVLYKGSSPSDNHGGIWASLPASQPTGNYFTILQSDGNLVTYKGTGPNDNQGFVWCNFTQGNDFLQIMDSQQLQVISGTTVLWQKP